MSEAEQQWADGRPVANADQEAWVQARIMTAMNMALSLQRERRVQADDPAFQYAMRGVAEGAALEVIGTLGMKPAFVNIRDNSGNYAARILSVKGGLSPLPPVTEVG